MSKSKQSKSKPPPTPDEILRRTKDTNIHAPDKVPLKNKIIVDIKDVLDEDIQNQINNLLSRCVLFVGNDVKAKLAACYAHCNRNIDLTDKIEGFRQSEEKEYKLQQEKLKEAELLANPSFPLKISSYKSKPKKQKRSLDDIIKVAVDEHISSLTRFVYVNCFGIDLMKFKEYTTDSLNLFCLGHTVFLENLKIKDSVECIQFIRDLQNIRINKLDDDLGLFIVGTDNINNLTKNLRNEFQLIELISQPLFLDDKNNALYFDKSNIATFKPEEIKLIKYLQGQEVFELEQILTEFFKMKLTETYKHQKNISDVISGDSAKPPIEGKSKAISRGDRNIFEVYKTNINKKFGMLGMDKLIQNVKRGTKVFKLSRKVEIKRLSLNEFLNSNKI